MWLRGSMSVAESKRDDSNNNLNGFVSLEKETESCVKKKKKL